ncbi:MAG TPA: MAPEG family protein [Allosphingosinicella sp.]|nr:MAPEG family protein [Allosphingosinicella sp.]
MQHIPILAPVVALVDWTLVMQIWMYATRLPAMRRMGIDLKGRRGGRGAQLDGVLADEVQWKAHNYNHLLEQPTLFYAIALTLALTGGGLKWSLWLAWAYVGLRVLHSLIQATSNVVRWRFLVFSLASLVLLALTVHTGMILLHLYG